jgi:hypothetical protein
MSTDRFTISLVALASFHFASASLLIRDRNDPCVAYGNATKFDLRGLGTLAVKAPRQDVPGDFYEYTYNCRSARSTRHCSFFLRIPHAPVERIACESLIRMCKVVWVKVGLSAAEP